MESSVISRERGAGPRMATDVKRVLVALSLILVFEAVTTEGAVVLLFSSMGLQFFGSLESFRLLGTAVTHEQFLKLGAARLWNLHLSRAGA